MNAVVAETDEEARRLALPQLHAMLALRTGQELRPQRLVEEAEKVELPPAHLELVEAMAQRWVIGSPGPAPATGSRSSRRRTASTR